MPPKGKVTTQVGPPHDSHKRQASNADQQPTKRTHHTHTVNANDDNHKPEEEEEEEHKQEEEEELKPLPSRAPGQ